MQKIMTLLFCVFLALTMAGCGQSQKNDAAKSAQGSIVDRASKAPVKQKFTPVTEVKEGRKDIYVLLKVMKGDYWERMIKGIADAGAASNCNVYVGGPYKETNWEVQDAMLQELDAKKTDALILAPSDSLQLIPNVEKLQKKNIPVILVDSDLNTKKYNAAYMTNNFEAGSRAAAEMLALLRKSGVKDNDSCTVAIKVSNMHGHNMIDRVDGINAYWAKHSPTGWRLAPKVLIDYGDKSLSREMCHKAMKDYDDLKGFISCNNSTTQSTAAALMESKRQDVVLVGFDYAKETAKIIADPKINAVTIVQNQYDMGYKGVAKALALANGEKSEQEMVDTGTFVINIDNQKEYELKMTR